MKKVTSSGRSGLLLMELIIAILFFSLASAICLQLFVKAHTLGQDTRELDMAVRQASSVADILSQSEHPPEMLQKLFPGSQVGDLQSHLYFDQDFQPCNSENACYLLDITAAPSDDRTTFYTITVSVNESSDEIYRLEIMVYRPLVPDEPPVGMP